MGSAAFPATSQPEPHAQKLQQDGKGRALRVLDAILCKTTPQTKNTQTCYLKRGLSQETSLAQRTGEEGVISLPIHCLVLLLA